MDFGRAAAFVNLLRKKGKQEENNNQDRNSNAPLSPSAQARRYEKSFAVIFLLNG